MAAGDKAPAFTSEGYPLNGERLGIVWRLMWADMADGNWHKGMKFDEKYAKEVSPSTVRSLLNEATRRGFLVKRFQNYGHGAKRVFYRRKDMNF